MPVTADPDPFLCVGWERNKHPPQVAGWCFGQTKGTESWGQCHGQIQRNKQNSILYQLKSLYFSDFLFCRESIIWIESFDISAAHPVNSEKMVVPTLKQSYLLSKCYYAVTVDADFQRPLVLRAILLLLTWDLSEAPSNKAKCVTSLTRVKGVRDMFLVSRASGFFLCSGSPRMWPGLVRSLKQQISISQLPVWGRYLNLTKSPQDVQLVIY